MTPNRRLTLIALVPAVLAMTACGIERRHERREDRRDDRQERREQSLAPAPADPQAAAGPVHAVHPVHPAPAVPHGAVAPPPMV